MGITARKGILYLVPTPIGNLGDMTHRAVETLKSVDIIACEDTRHSAPLFSKLGIQKRLVSYHDFNESKRADDLIRELHAGMAVAVVTDAGTPGISDPAYRLVSRAILAEIDIIALPGASALLPALTASGLPADRFFFEGFLPHKSSARKKRLTELFPFPHTLVFYESPHRLEESLTDMLVALGDRTACVAREISKLHEEFARGLLSELISRAPELSRGEIVVIVRGHEIPPRRKVNKYAKTDS